MKRVVHPTERGQITIPKRIREALHLSPETPLAIRQEDSRIIIEPLNGFDALAERLEQEAHSARITPDDLAAEMERVRRDLFARLYGSPQ